MFSAHGCPYASKPDPMGVGGAEVFALSKVLLINGAAGGVPSTRAEYRGNHAFCVTTWERILADTGPNGCDQRAWIARCC